MVYNTIREWDSKLCVVNSKLEVGVLESCSLSIELQYIAIVVHSIVLYLLFVGGILADEGICSVLGGRVLVWRQDESSLIFILVFFCPFRSTATTYHTQSLRS